MSSEREAFERLFAQTHIELLAYALRRSRCAEDAADVVSETYLIAWRKIDQIPDGERARMWLFGVAANVLRRGAARHHASTLLVARLAGELAVHTAAEQFEREDHSLRALRAGLASLPARDREIVTLSAWEGLSPKQIGQVLQLPANVVRVRLHRARRRLIQRVTEAEHALVVPDPEMPLRTQ